MRSSRARRSAAFGGFGGSAAPAAEPLEVKGEDFDTFERLLGEVQTAYGREDLAALRSHVTPEMLSYYAEDFSENASRGVVNEISDVKLLQGDLAEAWREGDKEYAIGRDALLAASTATSIARPAARPMATSSRRRRPKCGPSRARRGGSWLLSAIQQTQ